MTTVYVIKDYAEVVHIYAILCAHKVVHDYEKEMKWNMIFNIFLLMQSGGINPGGIKTVIQSSGWKVHAAKQPLFIHSTSLAYIEE